MNNEAARKALPKKSRKAVQIIAQAKKRVKGVMVQTKSRWGSAGTGRGVIYMFLFVHICRCRRDGIVDCYWGRREDEEESLCRRS